MKTKQATTQTIYIVPDLTEFFSDDWKEVKMQHDKINIYISKKYCTD